MYVNLEQNKLRVLQMLLISHVQLHVECFMISKWQLQYFIWNHSDKQSLNWHMLTSNGSTALDYRVYFDKTLTII